MADNGQLEVSVWRGDSGSGRFESFRVPAEDNQTVLDVVSWIQQNLAGDLAYRFACRVGMCGSCAMTVNGTPRWTCRTHVKKVARNNRLTIAPLANLPVIRDLATDMDPFFARWIGAGGRFVPQRTRDDPVAPVRPDSPGRQAADAGIECINCGVCHAACDTVAASPDYLGPAPLQRAWTLVNDERHGARGAVLAAVSGAGGCHNCHSMGNCTAHCPKELDPLRAIAGLKRATFLGAFGKEI
ncbi:MAG: succinate dehydrogenase/fumarate reductase iron-sulfur subunit [Alphaproteobacteria bacterium]|nr:MAG: succinate dehydrogenase/fumarate reductase iron-sulfur subunit [Alphaproteobacteria bacterium]